MTTEITPSIAAATSGAELESTETVYYSDQNIRKSWYLEGSPRSDIRIGVEKVWDEYDGSGVTVAVLDSQIDATHKDLSKAYDASIDYHLDLDTGDFTASHKNASNNHGTLVAGVISSEADNALGTVGVAHGATLMGLGMNYSSSSIVEQALAGLKAGASADVINNSWSFTANLADNFAKSTNVAMAEAVEFVATEGREGLGTSMVFAAGNMGTSGTSNYHNFQNSPYTISVGAVDRDGDASYFTSIGSNVLISAPGSDVFTTSTQNTFSTVSGTSFAAPVVSSVVALMLEANPDLGYRDIQQILALSAKKEGLGEGSKMAGDWVTNGADNFNGGGMHFSESFGYGFVNALAAVRLAETWTKQQTVANRSSIEESVKLEEALVAGERDRIEVALEITENIKVEHVQVAMNLSWSLTGDLDVYLISPEGTEVRLVHDLPSVGRIGSLKNFSLTSVASMGEMSAGTWTLVVQNNNTTEVDRNGDPVSGKLRGVTIEVHGSAEDISDDVYVYTDEFASLYDADEMALRSVLNDTDGGTDAINAAAVTTASVIDLGGKLDTVIAGRTLDMDGSTIENVYGGDGDDTLAGNDGDNVIMAGRGNDVVHLGLGADTLDGGAGEDTLFVDGLIGSVTGFVTDAGNFMMGFIDGALAMLTGFEAYSFSGTTVSYGELMDALSSDTPPADDPVVEPPVDEDPVTEDPVDEPPVEEPPVEEPPVDEPPVVTDPPVVEEPADDALADSYEIQIVGTDSADRLRGSGDAEYMQGGLGEDYLVGNAGDDYLRGGADNDKIRSSEGNDIAYGDAGDDVLMGNEGNDHLLGGLGNDTLRGDIGDDTLRGGEGSDALQGGEGADLFVYDVSKISGIDTISDFSVAEGDRLLLEGVVGSDDASFTLVDNGRFATLEMQSDGGPVALVNIFGTNASEVSISQLADDAFLLF